MSPKPAISRLGPEAERPRERLYASNVGHLATTELLALVVGAGIPGTDARSVADSLIADAGGLAALSRASAGELLSVPGVGRARAARIVAAFELGRRALRPSDRSIIRSPRDVDQLLRPRLAGLTVETGVVVGLNAKNEVLFELEIARGEVTGIPVHPREVFRPLIRNGAVSGIFAHNHPSGDPTPSDEDIDLTHRLMAVGELIGIPLIDHLVIATNGYRSIAPIAREEALQ